MDKLKMHSPDLTQQNIDKLLALFPNCKTEKQDDNGNLSIAVDFDLLKQELSKNIVEGPKERYQLNWPGKKEALLTANAPIAKTLRPCREESVDFDTTENLFIEGDNLEALKILQEVYLEKVRIIYIDPPYNTGKDFIYPDNFAESSNDYLQASGQKDEEGKRLVSNSESNGRFHSDWLSMMYSRLKISRNLLKDDGVIFVSINDSEAHNIRKILDEIFGAENFIACLIWDKNHSAQAGIFKVYHEYVYVYAKNIFHIDTPSTNSGELFEAGAMKRESQRHPSSEFLFPAGVRFNAADGFELKDCWGGIESVELIEGRMVCENGKTKYPVKLKAAYTQKNQMEQYFYGDRGSLIDSRGQKIDEFYFTSKGKVKIVKLRSVETPQSTLKSYGTQGGISTNLATLFGLSKTPLDNPKSVEMLSDFVRWFSTENDLILDFFAGASTTAHAIFKLNACDNFGRKFVMVQLPEEIEENHEAYRSGYKTIADISKERIRRAGTKIKEENPEATNLDTGFRVLKIDSSNMENVYYTPDSVAKDDLFNQVEHIKSDRTAEDLLFQVMLDWGVDLALPIRKETIEGKEVYFVNDDDQAPCDLVACFEKGIDEPLIKALAAKEPLRIVFRDDGFASDSLKINVEQIFKQLAPATDIKVI